MSWNASVYPHQVEPNFKGDGTHYRKYLADARLRRAVNLSIALGRPLLVRGEPGVGKTKLARAVAEELTNGNLLEWRIKSSDKVRDGLYSYDPIRRLIDTQLISTSPELQERAVNPYNYVRFSYLGKAIINPNTVVLLIDEIDKADLHFANDLLRELDDWWFQIDEVPLGIGKIKPEQFGERQNDMNESDILRAATENLDAASEHAIIHLGSKPRPIVIITSNDDKQLPPAFLRRCIVHTIQFPDLNDDDAGRREANRDHLRRIIEMNIHDRLGSVALHEEIVKRVLDIFAEIRKYKTQLSKVPATAELVEWLVALHHPSFSNRLSELTEDEPLPNWQLMFKTLEDEQLIEGKFKGKLEVEP